MRNKFADAIYEISKTNPRICALVADISPAGSMVKFREEFPKRFINCGVAEQAMIGIAAGMALKGMRPFCYTIATFSLYRPFEMVRDDLAYQNLPVTVIGMGAGVIYSTLGGTHHTMEDIAVASAIPNMTVLAPCDPEEMRLATTWCATESTGPVYMRLGKAGEPDLTSGAVDPFEVGKLRYIVRGEGDLCILTYGITMKMAFDVADRVRAKTGKRPSIVSVHTIKPLDEAGVLAALNAHARTVVIEEHVPHGGLASRVKEIAWDNGVTNSVKSVTLKDEFIHFYGSYEELLARHGLEAGAITDNL
ncbi:transketolase C-terminal domain-containing protein [Thalassospiraceae bacterium LMO-SO8]|nr:transketolase [Alphaproteobacteria bacterium LMO-S08]WND77652.1 transketolase C-terminal domain-containing protein [Thalassospiraceae bacterium LMO-SO8]